jgi:hypothetical protein
MTPPNSIVLYDPADPKTIYASTGLSGLSRSTNAGVDWSTINTPSGWLTSLAISPRDNSILYAGYYMGAFKSTDKGESWAQVTFGISLAHSVLFRIDPRDDQVVYALIYSQGIFKSTDGGLNWFRIDEGIPSTSHNYSEFVFNPANVDEIYLGLNGSGNVLFRTTDAGFTWTSYSTGLPDTFTTVTSIAIDTVHSRIFAATYANPEVQGIYTTDSALVGVSASRSDNQSGFSLFQNYPNPFNPSTTTSFSLPHAAVVSLKVYDVLGREVATLVDGREEAGEHSVKWNAEGFASGVFFYRLKAGDFVQTRKLVLVR